MEDKPTYCVLLNDEEQYSLWLARKPIPPGWRPAGFEGAKSDCVAFVDTTWVDMRPKSLRDA